MNLQQLRDKEITMDRPHNAGLINDHIEATIMHLLQSDCSELDVEGDWSERAQEKILELDGETSCWLSTVDANYYFVGGVDIWLKLDYDIEVTWDGQEYPYISDVFFGEIMCYWMDMEFKLSSSDAIQLLIRDEIKTW